MPFNAKIIGRIWRTITVLCVLGLAMRAALDTATTVTAADAAVAIDSGTFTPLALTISIGTRVVWMNQDPGTPYTVMSDTGLWDSGPLPSGGTFAFTFTQPGTFAYHGDAHPDMRGTVTVIASGATLSSSPTIIPDGLPRAGGGGEAVRVGRSRTDFFISIIALLLLLASTHVFVSARVQR